MREELRNNNFENENFAKVISEFKGIIGNVEVNREDFYWAIEYILSAFLDHGIERFPNELISWILAVIENNYRKQDGFNIGELEEHFYNVISGAYYEAKDFSTFKLNWYFCNEEHYTEEFHKIDLNGCFDTEEK